MCVQVAGNGHTHKNTRCGCVSPSFLSLHSLEINLGWVSRQLTEHTERLCVCLCVWVTVVGSSVSLFRSKGCRWPSRASLPLLSLPLTSFEIKAVCLFQAYLNLSYCFHVTLRKQRILESHLLFVRITLTLQHISRASLALHRSPLAVCSILTVHVGM